MSHQHLGECKWYICKKIHTWGSLGKQLSWKLANIYVVSSCVAWLVEFLHLLLRGTGFDYPTVVCFILIHIIKALYYISWDVFLEEEAEGLVMKSTLMSLPGPKSRTPESQVAQHLTYFHVFSCVSFCFLLLHFGCVLEFVNLFFHACLPVVIHFSCVIIIMSLFTLLTCVFFACTYMYVCMNVDFVKKTRKQGRKFTNLRSQPKC